MRYLKSILMASVVFTCLQSIAGCAGSVSTSENILVEGQISVRGHEPFTAVILVTESRNYYVLNLSDADRSDLLTPARYRIRGRLYLDSWNGRDFAHVAVTELTPLDL